MSMPHVCKCGICGEEFPQVQPPNPFGGYVAMPMPPMQTGMVGVMCTLHGFTMNELNCPQCTAKPQEAPHDR